MHGITVEPDALARAARELEGLVGHVEEIKKKTHEAIQPLEEDPAGFKPPAWGWWGVFGLTDQAAALIDEFRVHIDELGRACEDIATRIADTAHSYSDADREFAAMMSEVNDAVSAMPKKVRQINAMSQLYTEHRNLYSLALATPMVGPVISIVFGIMRFLSNLRSDDPYNIVTDLSNIAKDLTFTVLVVPGEWWNFRTCPLTYLTRVLVFLGLEGSLAAKDSTNYLIGDTVRIGIAAYQFDSIARSLRQLGDTIADLLERNINSGRWASVSGNEARVKLAAFSEGIRDTAGKADLVAASLQLSSAIIFMLEGVLKLLVFDLIYFMVSMFLAASMRAVHTAGLSFVSAKIASVRQAQFTLQQVSLTIGLANRHQIRIGGVWHKIILALKDSKAGQKFFYSPNHVGYSMGHSVIDDAKKFDAILGKVGLNAHTPGKHAAKPGAAPRVKATFVRACRRGVGLALQEFGFGYYATKIDGTKRNDGKWVAGYRRVTRPGQPKTQYQDVEDTRVYAVRPSVEKYPQAPIKADPVHGTAEGRHYSNADGSYAMRTVTVYKPMEMATNRYLRDKVTWVAHFGVVGSQFGRAGAYTNYAGEVPGSDKINERLAEFREPALAQ